MKQDLNHWLRLSPRVLFCILVGAILINRFVLTFDPDRDRIPQDFGIYHQAAVIVSDGSNPYRSDVRHSFKYAPGALLFFQALPAQGGRAWVWFGSLSILFFVLGLGLAGPREPSWGDWVILAGGTGLAWKGIIEALDYGQIDLLLFGLVTIGFWAMARFKERGGIVFGSIVGIVGVFKLPFFVLFLPALALDPARRRHSFYSVISSAAFFGVLLPLGVWGWDRFTGLTSAWLNLLGNQPPFLYADPYNQSLFGSILRMFLGFPRGEVSEFSLTIALVAFGLACMLGGLILTRIISQRPKFQDSPLGESSVWMIFAQLLNPLGWRWGSIFLVGLPLLMGRPKGATWLIAGAFVLLVLIQQNPLVRELGLNHWTDLHRFGTVTLLWVLGLAWVFLVPRSSRG